MDNPDGEYAAGNPFQYLGERNIDATDCIHDEASWAKLLAIVDNLDPQAAAGLRHGITQVLLRAIETALLGASPLVRISEFWESLSGQIDERIADRVESLIGEVPGEPLVRFLRSCLHANVLKSERKAVLDKATVLRVFEQHRATAACSDLRCVICGFHFRKQDLSPLRRRCAQVHGFRLARNLEQSRITDSLKPCSAKYTRLHLDHIIPEASHGGKEPDNLQITCAYCNWGRRFYWRSVEGLSMFVAGALAWMPSLGEESRGRSLRHAASVAAYQWYGSRCSSCESPASNGELTVSLPQSEDQLRFWGLPWKLVVRCYRCKAGASE